MIETATQIPPYSACLFPQRNCPLPSARRRMTVVLCARRAFSPRKFADNKIISVTPFAHYHLIPVTYSLIASFSAKERDTETGLSYFGARYYSSDLSIWLSVDPMSGKYPSLSPYVYCANNPVKLVDPNGEELIVADNDESRNDILSIVNDYNRCRVTFDEEGRVHVDMTDLKKEDAGLSLLHDLEVSDKRFYYETSDVALHRTECGTRTYTDLTLQPTLGCLNASNNGLDSQGKHSELPREGYDGQVVISKTGSFVWGNVNRRKNVVFHELAENYLRTAEGMNYLGPKGIGAHATAKSMEFQAWGSIETGAENYFPIDKHFCSDSPMYNKVIEYMIYGKY